MSMRAAINAKCKDCIYDTCAPGNWRQQVEGCAIRDCSLWPYRPKSKSKRQSDAVLAPFQTEPAEPLGVVAGEG
jgi:hypothetical protein